MVPDTVALKRMFNLAKKQGVIHHVPEFPDALPESVREGFIEDEEFDRIRQELPGYLSPVLATLYETGMRKCTWP